MVFQHNQLVKQAFNLVNLKVNCNHEIAIENSDGKNISPCGNLNLGPLLHYVTKKSLNVNALGISFLLFYFIFIILFFTFFNQIGCLVKSFWILLTKIDWPLSQKQITIYNFHKIKWNPEARFFLRRSELKTKFFFVFFSFNYF